VRAPSKRRQGLGSRLCIGVIGGLALGVGFAVAATLLASETLTCEIRHALTTLDKSAPSGDLIIVCGPPTGVGRGIQFGLLALLLGCMPAAILTAAFSAHRRTREKTWSAGWDEVFFAGLVFQLNSVAFTALLLVAILLAAHEAGAQADDVVSFAVPMTLSLGCGVWGVRSWRTLQGAVEQTSAMISLRESA
jgi:hypothetical protein